MQSGTYQIGDEFWVEGVPVRGDFLRDDWRRQEKRRLRKGKPVSMLLKSISCRDLDSKAAVVFYGILPSGQKCHVVAGYTPFFEVCGRPGEDPSSVRERFEGHVRECGSFAAFKKVVKCEEFRARHLMQGDIYKYPEGVVRYHFPSVKEMSNALKVAETVISAAKSSKTLEKFQEMPDPHPDKYTDEDFDDSHMPNAARNTKGVSKAVREGRQPSMLTPRLSLSLSMNSKSQQDRMIMYLYGFSPGDWVTIHEYRTEASTCEDCERKYNKWAKCPGSSTRECPGMGACTYCARAGKTWKWAECSCSTLSRITRAAAVDFNRRKGGVLIATRILPKKIYPKTGKDAHKNAEISRVRKFCQDDWPELDTDARETTPEFDLVYDIETYADPERCIRSGKPPQGDDPESRLMMISMLLYKRGMSTPVASVMISDTKLQSYKKFVKETTARAKSDDPAESSLAKRTLAHVKDAFPNGWDVVRARYKDSVGMLKAFAGVFAAFDPDVILDYNGHDYDMPFIKAKVDEHLYDEDRENFYSTMNTFRCGWGNSDWGIWSKFPAKIDGISDVANTYFKFDSCVSVDLMMQLLRSYPSGVPDPDKPGSMTKRLDAFLREFNLSPKIEHSFVEMWRAYEKKDTASLSWSAWYCMWDSAGTYRLCNETGTIAAREPFALEGFCSIDAAFHRGDGMRVEGAIFAETAKRGYTFCYDTKSAHSPKIRGAWVKPPRPGFPSGHVGAVEVELRKLAALDDSADSGAETDSDDSDDSADSDSDSEETPDEGVQMVDRVAKIYKNTRRTDYKSDKTSEDADPNDGIPLADYDFTSQYPMTFAAANRSYETVTDDEYACKRACLRMGRQWRVIDCEFVDGVWEPVPIWTIHHDDVPEQMAILPTVTNRWLARRTRMKKFDLAAMKTALGQLKQSPVNIEKLDEALATIDPHWGLSPDKFTVEEKNSPEFADKVARKRKNCDRQQNAVKKLANTAYGKTAMGENNRLLCPALGGATTAEARYSIHVCADMASEDRTTAADYMKHLAKTGQITPYLAEFELRNRKALAIERRRKVHENTHDYTDTDSVYVGLRNAGVSAFVRSMVGISGDDLKLALTALRDYSYPYALTLAAGMNKRLREHYGNTYMNVKLEGLHMRRLFIRSKCYFSLKIGSPKEDPTPSWTTDTLDYSKFERVYNMCGVSVKKKDTPPVISQYTMWLVNQAFALRAFGSQPDFRGLTRKVIRAFLGKEPLYEGAPELTPEDFVSSAKYNPDNKNISVHKFVDYVKTLESQFILEGRQVPSWATPPIPGMRFKFVICGSERQVLLSGKVVRLSVGERMRSLEHYQHSQDTDKPLVLDMEYYSEKKVAPMLGEILSHLPEFSKHEELPEDPTDKQSSDATAASVKAASKWVNSLLSEEMQVRAVNYNEAKRAWKDIQARMRPDGTASEAVLAGTLCALAEKTRDDAVVDWEADPDHYKKLLVNAERRAAKMAAPPDPKKIKRRLAKEGLTTQRAYAAIGGEKVLRVFDGKKRQPGPSAASEHLLSDIQMRLDRSTRALRDLNDASFHAIAVRSEFMIASMRGEPSEDLAARAQDAEKVCSTVDKAVDAHARLLIQRTKLMESLRALRSMQLK